MAAYLPPPAPARRPRFTGLVIMGACALLGVFFVILAAVAVVTAATLGSL